MTYKIVRFQKLVFLKYIYIYICKLEILLYPILNVYECEPPSWRLDLLTLAPNPIRTLYL